MRRAAMFLELLCLLLLLSPVPASDCLAQEVKIVHINVGQGDATLMLGPEDDSGERVAVLMDAGDIKDKDGGEIVGAVLEENDVGQLDYFIASHYHADHIGGVVTGEIYRYGHSFILGPNNVPGAQGDDDNDGAEDWLDDEMTLPDPEELGNGDDIPVEHFVDRGDYRAPTSTTYEKYVAMADAMGQRTSITTQALVDSFDIDLGGGATMQCLAANGYVRDRGNRVPGVTTQNERSLCFLLSFDGFHYLIGGDTIGRTYGSENARVEEAIGEYIEDNDINLDVLQVNHHGGNNASDTTFLRAIDPEVAIISLGNGNRHHHPHRDALSRLADANVAFIYQTEWGTTRRTIPARVRERQAICQGDIILTTDGDTYEIFTAKRFDVDD